MDGNQPPIRASRLHRSTQVFIDFDEIPKIILTKNALAFA
jgi:hypothetical protein